MEVQRSLALNITLVSPHLPLIRWTILRDLEGVSTEKHLRIYKEIGSPPPTQRCKQGILWNGIHLGCGLAQLNAILGPHLSQCQRQDWGKTWASQFWKHHGRKSRSWPHPSPYSKKKKWHTKCKPNTVLISPQDDSTKSFKTVNKTKYVMFLSGAPHSVLM